MPDTRVFTDVDALVTHDGDAAPFAPDCTVSGSQVTAKYDVLTKVSIAGRRAAAHVDESFVIPAEDGQIHHIRVRIRPFIKR